MALSLTAGVLASTNNALFTLADFDCNKSDHHISATKFLSATCQSCSCRHTVGRQAGVPETAASRPMEGMCPSKAHKSRKPQLLRNTVLVNVWPTQFINKLINQSYYYCCYILHCYCSRQQTLSYTLQLRRFPYLADNNSVF